MLDVALTPLVARRDEVVGDVARQPRLLVEVLAFFRGEVERRDAGEDEGTDARQGDPLPPGSVEAWVSGEWGSGIGIERGREGRRGGKSEDGVKAV